MATTFVEYTGDGNATKQFTFPSYQESDVKVRVDGVLKTTSTHYNITSYTTTGGGNVVFTAGNIPSNPALIRIYRDTSVDVAKATYTAGSSVKAADLNNNNTQLLYRAQEEQVPNLIQSYDIAASGIETSNIKDANITTAKIADSNVTTAKIADSNITTAKIADSNVTNAKIANDAVTTAKIGDNTVSTALIQNSAVTQNKLADNSVGTPEIINGAVTRVKLEADIIDGTKLADNAVDSEHYTDGSIDTAHIGDSQITANKLATDSVSEAKIVGSAVTTGKIAGAAVTNAKIANDAVTTDKIGDNSISTALIQDDAVTIGKIADAAIVTNSEQASHSVDDNTFFTTAAAEARYFNVSTGETIKDGDTFPDNDTTIATTAAINDRIIDLVDDVGGFVPLANEVSFPTANPDVNNGTGTLLSIKELSQNLTSNNSGSIVIANAAGGATVTIGGAPANTTFAAGFGMIVETKTTANQYTFHRLVPKATEVTTVAGKATEIGRLGTAAAVEDMSILGTADAVADMAILGTADVVSDMNTLGTADVVADMNTLAVTSVINDMDTVATNVTNVNNVGGSIANVNTTAGSIANVNTVAGSISNVNTVGGAISNVNTTAGSISNVNTVASNISSVNSFANTYRIGSANPTTSLDVGDLFFNTTSDSLKVYTGSAWVDGVTQTGDFALKTGNTFTGTNIHNDNVKSIYGTNQDLQVFHNGTENIITTNNSGVLQLRCNGTEKAIEINPNNNVELYFDNSKKFETTTNGVEVTGRFKTNADYNYLTSDSTTNATLTLKKTAGGADSIDYLQLRNNANTAKLIINGDGTLNMYDDSKIKLGDSADLQLYHDQTDSRIHNGTGNLTIKSDNILGLYTFTGTEAMAKFIANGAVELYHNNIKKLQTVSSGIEVLGTEETNCELFISADEGDDNNDKHKLVAFKNEGRLAIFNYTSGSWEQNLSLTGNGEVKLFYDNSEKFETNSTGAKVYGSLLVDNILDISPPGNNAVLIKNPQNGIIGFGTNNQSNQVIITADGHLGITGDNKELRLGASEDLKIAHDGTDNLITTTGTVLAVHRATTNAGNAVFEARSNHGATNQVKFKVDGDGDVLVPTDTGKLQFGVGQDFEIFHNGTNNYLQGVNGVIHVRSNYGMHFDTIGSGMTWLKCNTSNNQLNSTATSVELYYANSKKFETTSGGAKLSGHLYMDDNYSLRLGTNEDLNIYHDNVNSYIKEEGTGELRLGSNSGVRITKHDSETLAFFDPDAGVDLYYDNNPKLQTQTNGLTFNDQAFFSNNGKYLHWGATNQLYMGHSGSIASIINTSGEIQIRGDDLSLRSYSGNEKFLESDVNGSTKIYHNDSKRLETHTNGIMTQGENQMSLIVGSTNAGGAAVFLDGDSDGDVSGGDYSWIRHNTSGNLELLANKPGGGSSIDFYANAGTLFMQLTSGGHLVPYTSNQDLGLSGNRWRNIYTNDLHLSNEGGTNDVDGTWGDWTMQEGESDLFLKNNRSGKKYKFNLTEVS